MPAFNFSLFADSDDCSPNSTGNLKGGAQNNEEYAFQNREISSEIDPLNKLKDNDSDSESSLKGE